ncbi:Yip1 domain-containing protein [Clostridium amylolyticum]|uniref:Yip1 domain-containing protein n=1 Tax=Clostridium amylolyticum TaxID=1121298 RepID=A0A1M6IRQ3_9CLOT|nr:Yip1 family protein [Clostridium amylolyticum]SHJ37161.1 Yip1 domain-containing protein [Clostridium amylolyticum]
METNNFENNEIQSRLTLGEKIKYFFINPQKLFEDYLHHGKYAIPMVIVVAISTIVAVIQGIISKEALKGAVDKQLNTTPGMDPAALGIAQSVADVTTSPIFVAITTIVGILIGIYFTTLIYWLVSKMFKGTASYSQMVGVYVISYFPVVIGSIIRLIYDVIVNKPIDVNAAANLSVGNVILAKLNVFGIWQMLLLVIGIAVVAKISKKKSIGVVVIIWALGLTFSLMSLGATNALKGITPPSTPVP